MNTDENKWDDLTIEDISHKYSGDYITISKFGRFSMKAETIFKHEEFKDVTHCDVRYSKKQNAFVFLFNREKRGVKITFHKANQKNVTFGTMHLFARMNTTEVCCITKKYIVEKEHIPERGCALVLYFENEIARD